jgi:uncharacterized protein YciU (UPF0263 family)
MKPTPFTRPPLATALTAWEKSLTQRRLPAPTRWIFAENLCIEQASKLPETFEVHFQTRFTPPADDALEIAYDQFSETNGRMVFYRLGSAAGKSVAILLCDDWFEKRGAAEGFERHDDWGISFFSGVAAEIEEVTDLSRWLRRVQGRRAFDDFDFAMSLQTIDEIKIHGRQLQPYERFAEQMLNRLRRVLGNP